MSGRTFHFQVLTLPHSRPNIENYCHTLLYLTLFTTTLCELHFGMRYVGSFWWLSCSPVISCRTCLDTLWQAKRWLFPIRPQHRGGTRTSNVTRFHVRIYNTTSTESLTGNTWRLPWKKLSTLLLVRTDCFGWELFCFPILFLSDIQLVNLHGTREPNETSRLKKTGGRSLTRACVCVISRTLFFCFSSILEGLACVRKKKKK